MSWDKLGENQKIPGREKFANIYKTRQYRLQRERSYLGGDYQSDIDSAKAAALSYSRMAEVSEWPGAAQRALREYSANEYKQAEKQT